ncbi:MAG: hypothetical protein U9O41_05415 [Candidatus Aerophobetes bacterium]|nr:hypothetical protein [Candidatus Aerophobetes bacterium]
MKIRNILISILVLFQSFHFITMSIASESMSTSSPVRPFIKSLSIVSSTGGNIPDDENKIVGYKDEVNLFAVIRDGEGNYYLGYDDYLPDKVRLIRAKLKELLMVGEGIYSIDKGSLKRWNREKWGELSFRWYKVVPKMAPSHPSSKYKWYSNVFTEYPDEGVWSGFDIIEYKQELLSEKSWRIHLPREAGTVRFRVEVDCNGRRVSSPGRKSSSQPSGIAAQDYDKGIKPTVHKISRFSNHENRLIRYIEAFKGVPWCWGAEYKKEKELTTHQSELSNPICIECSDLVIAALRAIGNENLRYTTADELARGKYTKPIDERVFTYLILDLFQGWIPRGIVFHNNDFYLCGKEKIQIRDRNFKVKKEIEEPCSNYMDIAISKDDKIYLIGEAENREREIQVLNFQGKEEMHFNLKVERSIELGEEIYTKEFLVRPEGIDISQESDEIYLLSSDEVYILDLNGKLKRRIRLKDLYGFFVPTGDLAVRGDLIYVPVYDKKILVYNMKGEVVNKIVMKDVVFGLDAYDNKFCVVHMSPLQVLLYKLDGSFLEDFRKAIVDESGEKVIIPIGESENALHIGDLIMTGEEEVENFSHTMLLYGDSNSNGFLDGEDKVIYAGHKGVMISPLEEKLRGRDFTLRRFDASLMR